jgi:hypothetical protein
MFDEASLQVIFRRLVPLVRAVALGLAIANQQPVAGATGQLIDAAE